MPADRCALVVEPLRPALQGRARSARRRDSENHRRGSNRSWSEARLSASSASRPTAATPTNATCARGVASISGQKKVSTRDFACSKRRLHWTPISLRHTAWPRTAWSSESPMDGAPTRTTRPPSARGSSDVRRSSHGKIRRRLASGARAGLRRRRCRRRDGLHRTGAQAQTEPTVHVVRERMAEALARPASDGPLDDGAAPRAIPSAIVQDAWRDHVRASDRRSLRSSVVVGGECVAWSAELPHCIAGGGGEQRACRSAQRRQDFRSAGARSRFNALPLEAQGNFFPFRPYLRFRPMGRRSAKGRRPGLGDDAGASDTCRDALAAIR